MATVAHDRIVAVGRLLENCCEFEVRLDYIKTLSKSKTINIFIVIVLLKVFS